jgi:hypothetical protein
MTTPRTPKTTRTIVAAFAIATLATSAIGSTAAEAAKKTTKKVTKKKKVTKAPVPTSAAPSTEVPAPATTTTLAPATTTTTATTILTPGLPLAPSNGLKPGTAIAAGTYDFKVGPYSARAVLPAGSTTDLVDPNSVLFNVGKAQLGIFHDLQTFEDPLFEGKDFSANLRPFYPNSAAMEAKIRPYPFVDYKPVTEFQVGSIKTQRHEYDVVSAVPTKKGDFTISVPRIGSGFIPFAAYFDANSPSSNVHYMAWGPDGKPLYIYVAVVKGASADALLKSVLVSLQ